MKEDNASLLSIVNFYRKLLLKGTIAPGSSGHRRMVQLETRLHHSRYGVRGRRVVI